jgi:hypothetical protein
MRENRPYGSEGGEAKAFPTPIRLGVCGSGLVWIASLSLAMMEWTAPP